MASGTRQHVSIYDESNESIHDLLQILEQTIYNVIIRFEYTINQTP